MRFTKELKDTCIKEYIKRNTVSLKCFKCKSTSDLVRDVYFGTWEAKKIDKDIFCSACLIKSLSKDKFALEEVYAELHPEEF
jgi:hypothetical protein